MFLETTTDTPEINFSDPLIIAIIIVGGLIILVSLFSMVIEIWLAIRYIKYNHKENSLGLSGKDAARKFLDDNDLQHIKVSATGSLMFGNSYGHYFKKVRLRRLTYKKKSVTSLAMAAQKTELAIMDKEQDPDMVRRVRLTPIVYFGPFALIPLLLIGLLLDFLVFKSNGVCTIILTLVGVALFIASFVLQFMELKTEIKAQKRCYELLKKEGASEEDIELMHDLFRLYNIEYINNIILSILEVIWRILILILRAREGNSNSSKN